MFRANRSSPALRVAASSSSRRSMAALASSTSPRCAAPRPAREPRDGFRPGETVPVEGRRLAGNEPHRLVPGAPLQCVAGLRRRQVEGRLEGGLQSRRCVQPLQLRGGFGRPRPSGDRHRRGTRSRGGTRPRRILRALPRDTPRPPPPPAGFLGSRRPSLRGGCRYGSACGAHADCAERPPRTCGVISSDSRSRPGHVVGVDEVVHRARVVRILLVDAEENLGGPVGMRSRNGIGGGGGQDAPGRRTRPPRGRPGRRRRPFPWPAPTGGCGASSPTTPVRGRTPPPRPRRAVPAPSAAEGPWPSARRPTPAGALRGRGRVGQSG